MKVKAISKIGFPSSPFSVVAALILAPGNFAFTASSTGFGSRVNISAPSDGILVYEHTERGSAQDVTPALNGALLAGVTRDTLLTVASDLGYSAEEGKISTDDWQAGNESGVLTEVFACGTAAVITPVGF